MIAALLLTLAPSTLELSRGAEIHPGYRYWAVEDTYLEGSQPDENFGSALTLLGGPNRAVLIQFRDLERAVGPGKRIREARLVLTNESLKPALRSVERVGLPWNEGPLKPLTIRRPAAVPGPPRWSATWRQRRAGEGGMPWQQAGLQSPSDAEPIAGVKSEPTEESLVVTGLGPTFQRFLDRPYENHGIVLRFDNAVEFNSSQAAASRPRLVLELEDAPPKTGPDLAVVAIEGGSAAAGDLEIAFTARIKNVGNAPSTGFASAWITGERSGSSVDGGKALNPGEETTVTVRRPVKADTADHRTSMLGFRIVPKGADASTANDFLEVAETGFALDVTVPPSIPQPELYAQSLVRLWNEVYSPYSRFSFAPDGALERVRISRLSVGPANAAGSGDGRLEIAEGQSEAEIMRNLARALGVPDLSLQSVPAGSGKVDLPGFSYGTMDPYPGVTGGGDTRYEGALPGTLWPPYEPHFYLAFAETNPEPTGLLSATEVATINANLGKRRDRTPYAGVPGAVLVRVLDGGGRPISGQEVDFFGMKDGKFDTGAPLFSVATSDSGIAAVPPREGGVFAGGGVLLARAQRAGVPTYAWLKQWQIADAFARGNTAAAVAELRFNLPAGALDSATNLAANRIASASNKADAAKLAPMLDDDPATRAELPSERDGWIEIDLGRDRTIGEIRLSAPVDAMWRRFDVIGYATGQTASEAPVYAREVDWTYSATNRSESLGPVREVAYRAPSGRYRYIRLVNRGGGPGSLAGIRVVPLATP